MIGTYRCSTPLLSNNVSKNDKRTASRGIRYNISPMKCAAGVRRSFICEPVSSEYTLLNSILNIMFVKCKLTAYCFKHLDDQTLLSQVVVSLLPMKCRATDMHLAGL